MSEKNDSQDLDQTVLGLKNPYLSYLKKPILTFLIIIIISSFLCIITFVNNTSDDESAVNNNDRSINQFLFRNSFETLLINKSHQEMEVFIKTNIKNKFLKDFINEGVITATMQNDIPSIKILLKYGADINYTLKEDPMAPYPSDTFKGKSSLYFAVATKNYELTEFLLQNNADPNLVDAKGKTPLGYAFDHKLTELLLRYGGDPKSIMSD